MGIIAALLVVGLFGYFRWSKTARRELHVETDATRNAAVIKLSNVPFYGMFGLSITTISFFFLIVGLVGGLISMGNGAIGWLVSAIDWMYAVTGGLLTASLFCCAAERISHGRRGRTCEIDTLRKRITVQTEVFAETVAIDFDQIETTRVVSSRESWVRFGRTFSPTILYRDDAGSNAKVVLQRNLNRNQAIEIMAHLGSILGLDQDSGCEGSRALAQHPTSSTSPDSLTSKDLARIVFRNRLRGESLRSLQAEQNKCVQNQMIRQTISMPPRIDGWMTIW